MGGPGSGNHRGARPTTAGSCALDVLAFHRGGWLAAGEYTIVTWSRGAVKPASIGAIATPEGLRLTYSATPTGGEPRSMSYLVDIERTPCHFGGARPWFRCPDCGRRCRLLYQHGERYTCRRCARLAYATSQAHRRIFEEAQAAGVAGAGFGLIGPAPAPIQRLRERLERTRKPKKAAALRRRIARLEALCRAGSIEAEMMRMLRRLG